MSRDTLFIDTECSPNYWLINLERLSDGQRLSFELSERSELDINRLRAIMTSERYTFITFNGLSYDMPMIFYALSGATNKQLKWANDLIIQTGLKYWEVEKQLGIRINVKDHIDLIEPNPSVRQGQKTLAGRLHAPKMQDLPYHPDQELTFEQMDETTAYCWNDIEVLKLLYEALREPLALRVALGEEYGMDLRSKSDAQMGEQIIKSRVQTINGGKRAERVEVPRGESFRYPVPDWMSFKTEQLQDILETIRETDFFVASDGKVDLPKSLTGRKIKIGGSTYAMGIGGLHSTESNRALHSDADYFLIDADVASQYPSIIMKLGLYPKALGPAFLEVYGGLIKMRLIAKREGDKVRDQGAKIALNGAFGKLGSKYSILFAPHLLIAVTLTGQLSLLMLIEAAEAAGISVVSGNTDGVVFHCLRSREDDLKAIIANWEKTTGFVMETAKYRSLYNSSVNTYIAIKEDGKAKRKGAIANPWGEGDLRGQMGKNPQMTICSDAVLAYILHGTPIEQTIRACRDVKAFLTVIKVSGGGTWRDAYLGKVVRYIWAHDGAPILYSKPHPVTGNYKKASKTDGCRPIMQLPDTFPADIDYERYIAEAKDILTDIGGIDPDYVAPVRITSRPHLMAWLAAAA